MGPRPLALTPEEAGRVYDKIGSVQDWQAFYEDATADRVMARAGLGADQSIFELGCGTGRFAQRLLRRVPASVDYVGVDVSAKMTALTGGRLTRWADRARALLVDGSLPLPVRDGSIDRVLSLFVLDLLEADYARAVIDDLHRVLGPDGRVCLASLTHGDRLVEQVVSRAWTGLWRMSPALVGGCRPIVIEALLGPGWQIVHRSRVYRWGLVSEVVVATPASQRGPALPER